MKYESNVLKRLIDTYGVVGNPRYISEIIKEFIVRGKECFPNLFTYQSDWLAHIDEFGLNPTYTVSYTGQSFYAPNTLERPVKSAILKGSTKYRDIDTGEILESFEEGRNLELVSVKMPVLTTAGKNLFTESLLDTPSKKIIDGEEYFVCNGSTPSNSTFKLDVNKIDNKKEVVTFSFDVINPNNAEWCSVYIEYSDHPYATIKGVISSDRVSITSLKGKIPSYIYFTSESRKDVYIKNIQLEYNSTPTTYEPYKTNILSCLEPVELGSVGEVKDELNLLTQQLTQRTETRPYQEGDELNSEFVTDMTNTRYKLAQEVVKTVGLSILDQNGQNVQQLMSFNGGTHFNTTSSEGSLLPVVSVSVETDLEEILMMCSLEGNTL